MIDDKEKKKKVYDYALHMYGFLTLLYLIDQYIKEENFEECQIILDVMNSHNKEFNHNLPTKLNKDSINYFKEAVKDFGVDGDKILKTIPFYAEDIKDLINKITKL